jgi:hypothetical protein
MIRFHRQDIQTDTLGIVGFPQQTIPPGFFECS